MTELLCAVYAQQEVRYQFSISRYKTRTMTTFLPLNRWTKQSDSDYKISNLFKYVPVDYMMIILELYIGIGEVETGP